MIFAAVEEYNLRHHTESDEERRGRKAAVRGMLVRLGIYEHFDTALEMADNPMDYWGTGSGEATP